MNKIIDDLIQLNISDSESLEHFNDKTRDRLGLESFKCKKSKVIVLKDVHFDEDYYLQNDHYHKSNENLTKTSKETIQIHPLDDDKRRFNSYKTMLKGKSILDFGSGKGGFIKLCNEITSNCCAVELEEKNRLSLNEQGIECFEKIQDLGDRKFDYVTLNHVFEHLIRPLDYISIFHEVLNKDGVLIIEVPHAQDFLLDTLNLQAFKDFTLWSEHLILHTKKSLELFVTHNDKFKLLEIKGFQRYSLLNHLFWLKEGRPGGHELLNDIEDSEFHQHYQNYLNKINQTDTIIGFFKKK